MRIKKPPPPIVVFAILANDKPALSRMGRAGAMRRIEIRQKDREQKILSQLQFAEEIAKEANEHICPLD